MTDILSKKLRVTMPDGSKWDVLVRVIAENRARYYCKVDEVSFEDSFDKDTVPLFKSDEDEIIDWAENNMDWEDVKKWASKVLPTKEPDYQEGWTNGEKEIVE